MGGRGSSSSMGGGMGAGGGAGIAATQQQPQNAPPFAVPQGIKINAPYIAHGDFLKRDLGQPLN